MQTLSSHLSVTSRCPVICHNTQTVSRSYGVLPNLCRQKRRHAASSLTLPRCRPAQQAFSARKPLAGFVSSHPKRVQSSATATQAEPIAFTRPVEAEDCEEEDFYSILGVPSHADENQLKKAYYAIMRECHPDFNQDKESAEFSTIINEIYETLKHPEKRAAYDAIVGLSGDAINPFTDTSFERDQVFVDELTCIGCHNCTNVCPKTYAMEPDFGRARVMQQKIDTDELLQESIDCCPVDCIHWVTAPQLALLENSMSKLERLNTFLLATDGGNKSGVNVFLEASLAWEKRQAGIRARRRVAESQDRWNKWASASGIATGHAAQAGREDETSQKKIAPNDTASAAARAARRWRDLQRSKRNNADRLLLH